MRKFDVQIALEGVAEARAKWIAAKREFDADLNRVMGRLLHEAAACFMSVEEVSKFSGYKKIQVRSMMRLHGLDPRNGKTLLAKTAADALASNAELLGIPVHEMDLMSPLAYLPAGSELRQALTDKTSPSVHEVLDRCTCDEPQPSGSLNGGAVVCLACGFFIRPPERDRLVDIIEKAIFETGTGLEAALLAAERIMAEER